ncbi:hypothetical protein ASZ78_014651 [Callipepla squamata]|uniref:Long-chain-fatty-acid--CoA ligase ACSBG1 n=1 Tax=Callipepla squamata TaxID=9009 RepID=A0A226NDP9_CALSU|nr:hypothetical protein ASZ78_014651 [Callipepla squamata]
MTPRYVTALERSGTQDLLMHSLPAEICWHVLKRLEMKAKNKQVYNVSVLIVYLKDPYSDFLRFRVIWNRLPHLKAVVLYRDSVLERHPNLYTMEEFLKLGDDIPDGTLDDIINSQKPNQCCVLIYTSGTTGKPKGAMLSHDNGSLINTLKEVQPTSHMGVPRVWEKIMEKLKDASAQSGFVKKKMLSWAMSVSLERNLNCSSSSDLKQFWTRLADYLVLAKIRNALGFSSCQKHFCGAAPLNTETLYFFLGLNITLYEAYGMSETTGPHCLSGPYNYRQHSCGKPVPGCRVKLVNEDTEGNGEICFWGRTVFMGYLNMEDKTKEAFDEDGWLHSGDLGKLDKDGFLYVTGRIKGNEQNPASCLCCGKPVPGCRVKLVNEDTEGNGEICFWGRTVFMGYLNMEDKTKEAFDEDGWLHSGDLGKLDKDGFLYVTGRIKDLIITAGGENVPPIPIEDAVKKELPIVSNAMVIGDKKKFLSICGKPVPGCRVKLVNEDTEGNGEICFWGRTVFMGYLNMEDKTKEAFDEDGWLHSGDLGKLDKDGFLYVTGRIKDLIITAGGENVPPIPIEDAVKKELPIVSNAMVIGDKKKFLSMLLTLKVHQF